MEDGEKLESLGKELLSLEKNICLVDLVVCCELMVFISAIKLFCFYTFEEAGHTLALKHLDVDHPRELGANGAAFLHGDSMTIY